VLAQRLANDVLDTPARVEARVGVLENHLDAPAQLPALRRLECSVGVLAVEGKTASGGVVQAHQKFGDGALAAT
jgi:hypothetical protein